MPRRVDIAGAHALTNLELRRHFGIVTRRNTAAKTLSCNRRRESRRRFRRAGIRRAGRQFLRRDQAVLDQQLLIDAQPALVITHAQVVGRRKQFDLMTPRIQVPLAHEPRAHGRSHRCALPRRA